MLTAYLALLAPFASGELEAPFLVKAAGQPIKLDTGHAAPIYTDFDGDGLPDLLVGQFAEGRLRIYRNVGTRQSPKFDNYSWFQAGGKIASVSYG